MTEAKIILAQYVQKIPKSILGPEKISFVADLVQEMPQLAKKMRQITHLPLMFEVNAGRPQVDEEYRSIYSLEPQGLAEITFQLVEAGANIVGGCCGTTPEHIAAIKERLSPFASQTPTFQPKNLKIDASSSL